MQTKLWAQTKALVLQMGRCNHEKSIDFGGKPPARTEPLRSCAMNLPAARRKLAAAWKTCGLRARKLPGVLAATAVHVCRRTIRRKSGKNAGGRHHRAGIAYLFLFHDRTVECCDRPQRCVLSAAEGENLLFSHHLRCGAGNRRHGSRRDPQPGSNGERLPDRAGCLKLVIVPSYPDHTKSSEFTNNN